MKIRFPTLIIVLAIALTAGIRFMAGSPDALFAEQPWYIVAWPMVTIFAAGYFLRMIMDALYYRKVIRNVLLKAKAKASADDSDESDESDE